MARLAPLGEAAAIELCEVSLQMSEGYLRRRLDLHPPQR